MDILHLFLDARSRTDNLLEVSNKIGAVILKTKDRRIFSMIKYPLSAYKYYNIIPNKLNHIGGRAYLADDYFVVKYDEHFKANSLCFISNLFAYACKLRVPSMILSDKYSTDEGFYGNEKMLQVIDYIPDWKDYSENHPRGAKFVKQLAGLLSYDLVIVNSDRFLFISRYLDNILLEDDPDFEKMEIFEPDEDSNINTGNFGFVDGNLWSLDHRANEDAYFILSLHKLLTLKNLSTISYLMSEYFKLTALEEEYFLRKLTKYVKQDLDRFPLFLEMHNWVLSNK